MSSRPRPPMPEEPPAIPIEPEVAAERSVYVSSHINIVKQLIQEGKTQDEIKVEVSEFAGKYPALYKMLFKIDITNEVSLRTMMAMLDKMGKSQLTQDQASVIVGQRLYDTFIKSKIGEDKPPAS